MLPNGEYLSDIFSMIIVSIASSEGEEGEEVSATRSAGVARSLPSLMDSEWSE